MSLREGGGGGRLGEVGSGDSVGLTDADTLTGGEADTDISGEGDVEGGPPESDGDGTSTSPSEGTKDPLGDRSGDRLADGSFDRPGSPLDPALGSCVGVGPTLTDGPLGQGEKGGTSVGDGEGNTTDPDASGDAVGAGEGESSPGESERIARDAEIRGVEIPGAAEAESPGS